MQANHTPGPWTVTLSNDARNDDRVMDARGVPVLRGRITSMEDAALIAAAPDMLAALKVCESVLRIQGYANAADIAQAAIARATGEA